MKKNFFVISLFILTLIFTFGKNSESNAQRIYEGDGTPFSEFGKTVSGVGDFNGDGFKDFAVSQPTGGLIEVYIYYGGVNYDTIPDLTILSPGGVGAFGNSISAADLNLDGFSDIVIGSPNYSSFKGRVFI